MIPLPSLRRRLIWKKFLLARCRSFVLERWFQTLAVKSWITMDSTPLETWAERAVQTVFFLSKICNSIREWDEFSARKAECHQCSLKEEGDEDEDDPTSEVEEGEGGEDGQDDEFEDAWENYVLVGLLLWILLDVLMFLILKCASLVSWFSSLHMHTHILLEEVQVMWGSYWITCHVLWLSTTIAMPTFEMTPIDVYCSWWLTDTVELNDARWTVGFEKVCFNKKATNFMLNPIGLWLLFEIRISSWFLSYPSKRKASEIISHCLGLIPLYTSRCIVAP